MEKVFDVARLGVAGLEVEGRWPAGRGRIGGIVVYGVFGRLSHECGPGVGALR